jgi:hypothetical protein
MIIRVTHSGVVLQGPEQFDSFKVLADPLADVPAVLDRAGARRLRPKSSPQVTILSAT